MLGPTIGTLIVIGASMSYVECEKQRAKYADLFSPQPAPVSLTMIDVKARCSRGIHMKRRVIVPETRQPPLRSNANRVWK
jgi:hypothetical protein